MNCVKPKATIVMVTYNGLEKATRLCLESIFHHTATPDYEVIAVDNNSTDGTRAFLTDLASREPRLRVVLNNENRGFAGGNNDGLRAAQGDIIVLLNNDTLVTSGWLERMTEVLLDDRSVGLVGPATNSAGNEQNIPVSATTTEGILAEGTIWTEKGEGDGFVTDKLCFFCVGFRREILDQVGMLDETFGLGFYEDDDFCMRVRKAGYSLRCLEDVFVYHQGSATFKAMPRQTRLLLKRNKRLLESKHGCKYEQAHPRDRQLDLLEGYLDRIEQHGWNEPLWYRVNKRLQLVQTLQPRSLLKKIFFRLRLNRVLRRAHDLKTRLA